MQTKKKSIQPHTMLSSSFTDIYSDRKTIIKLRKIERKYAGLFLNGKNRLIIAYFLNNLIKALLVSSPIF